MSDPFVALLMLGLFIVFIFFGFPIAFTMMAMGMGFGFYAYFTPDQLEQYVAKQKKILSHLTTTIKPGGYLLYCTCSVSEKENEQQITDFVASSGFKIVKMQLFNGMPQKADSLFGALLQKISN